jgi:hypothetical protein
MTAVNRISPFIERMDREMSCGFGSVTKVRFIVSFLLE